MRGIGQTLVLGLINGGIYALFALGVSLVYRGTGALNFAQGEMGTIGLYVAWWVSVEKNLPWVFGAVAAIGLAAGLGVLFEMTIVRHMVEASRVTVAVATVGLLLFLVAVEFKYFGNSPRIVEPPIGGLGVRIFGVFVSPTQWLALVATIGVGVGLTTLLRRTDFGLGVLAAAQDPTAVRLVGVPLKRVSSFIWGMGAAISALGGLLIVPTVGAVTPGYATELFIWGLCAAVIGGLSNLPGAFVGGLAVGLIDVGTSRILANSSIASAEFVVVFIAILAVLVLRPQGLLSGVSLPKRLRGMTA